MKNRENAFTLTEVIVAMGVIAIAVTGLIALIPAALEGRSKSKAHTMLSVILEDVKQRIEGSELELGSEVMPISPLFYDSQGVLVSSGNSPGESPSSRRIYRVDVRLVAPVAENQPIHTEGLRTAIVEVGWPVNSESGEVLGGANKNRVVTSFHVTTLTGMNWTEVDPSFKPKIEY